MVEAWVKRGAERQALRESLMRKVYDVEEAGEPPMEGEERIQFELDLLQAIAAHLKKEAVERFSSSHLLTEEILPRIREFSRAPQEENALLAEFMSKLLESAEVQYRSELSRLEHADPQRIFGAPSAMSEVPL